MATGICGFTIVRNAELLDYPFQESVLSILPLVDEFIINCGDSTDGTAQLCESLVRRGQGKIRVLSTVWERAGQQGGFQLKVQSDRAAQEGRSPWLFYLQADEVIHEADHPRILSAVAAADQREDIDGVLFDYLHFYGNFDYTIRGRNWYRREVRLFKNGRGIEAFRDAQGFRKNGQRLAVLRSGARVYHYGYVRTSESLQRKSQQMAQWWGEAAPENPEGFKIRRHIGLTPFRESHPATMAARIARNAFYPNPALGDRRWDGSEIKNLVTFLWESIIPFRIGEFKNYSVK